MNKKKKEILIGKLPKMGMMMNILKPLVVISEKKKKNKKKKKTAEKLIEDDAELISTRKLSILDLN